MKRILTILILMQIPFCVLAQHEETFEIQADKVDSNSDAEIQLFYEKFNLWIKSLETDAAKIEKDESDMVDNFIIFSEDGLLMKDLDFHSVESCKNQILENLPIGKTNEKWIYITMESQVNKLELIEILKFLKVHNIDYHFGVEDEFVPNLMKNK